MTMGTQGGILGEVRLSRDPRRLRFVPLLGALGGVALAVGSWLVAPPGVAAMALLACGLAVAAGSVFLRVRLASIRLFVRAGALEVRWFGGRRDYLLLRGSLARISIDGGSAALRPRLGPLGVGLGRATLRGEERIELLRLTRASTMLLVPTDRGRLAIAAESEEELVAALRAAASAEQQAAIRPPVTAARPPTLVAPPLPLASFAPARAPAPTPAPAYSSASADPPPRLMTGIERALLEERLAAERAAALATAEAQAVDDSRSPAHALVAAAPARNGRAAAPSATDGQPSTGRRRARATWHRPAWLSLSPSLPSSSKLAAAVPIAAPLMIAAIGWGIAFFQERLSGPSPEARYLVLALALTGPMAVFATLVARSWQPRITGLVAWSTIGAQVVIARALLG